MSKFKKNLFGGGVATSLLNEASKEQAAAAPIHNNEMRIEYRNLRELVPNEKNVYSQEELTDLADSIRVAGRVLQPILYLDQQLPDGTYKIIAGHKRRLALEILTKEDPKWAENVPCSPTSVDIVDLPISDEDKEEYLIVATNKYRRKTDADLMYEYRFQKRIYTEAKKNGYKLSAKMREIIADELGVSPAQVGKLDYIEAHATEEVKKALEQNFLSISEAEQVAHKPEEEQEDLIANFMNAPESESTVPEEAEEWTKEAPAPMAKPSETPKKEVNRILKPKEKIIDTLTKESYPLTEEKIEVLSSTLSPLVEKVQTDTIILDKKGYAKYLASIEKIKTELEKIEKLLEKG